MTLASIFSQNIHYSDLVSLILVYADPFHMNCFSMFCFVNFFKRYHDFSSIDISPLLFQSVQCKTCYWFFHELF